MLTSKTPYFKISQLSSCDDVIRCHSSLQKNQPFPLRYPDSQSNSSGWGWQL